MLNASFARRRVRELRSSILESTQPRMAPLMRRFSDDAPEPAGEMRLITHAAAQRNGTERLTRRQHEVLRNFDSPAREIVVCRDPERGFERTAEVTNAESQQSRQVFGTDPFGQVSVDMHF
jgi:hypothetical protein